WRSFTSPIRPKKRHGPGGWPCWTAAASSWTARRRRFFSGMRSFVTLAWRCRSSPSSPAVSAGGDGPFRKRWIRRDGWRRYGDCCRGAERLLPGGDLPGTGGALGPFSDHSRRLLRGGGRRDGIGQIHLDSGARRASPAHPGQGPHRTRPDHPRASTSLLGGQGRRGIPVSRTPTVRRDGGRGYRLRPPQFGTFGRRGGGPGPKGDGVGRLASGSGGPLALLSERRGDAPRGHRRRVGDGTAASPVGRACRRSGSVGPPRADGAHPPPPPGARDGGGPRLPRHG